MDVPQVLAVIRPGIYWGPTAQTGATYAEFVVGWNSTYPTTPAPTEAEMLIVWNSLESNRPIAERDDRRTKAVSLATAKDVTAQLIRAELLLIMDELNILRQWITDYKAAVASASTLAALKTSTAALPNVPQRTASQIKPALITRISTPDAD